MTLALQARALQNGASAIAACAEAEAGVRLIAERLMHLLNTLRSAAQASAPTNAAGAHAATITTASGL